ncbi:hypothetical protein D6858_09920 [Tsuneonella suprasediminis]|uniref:Uncharacterized protein n=1 Tax=Tsuneonella suprasediminis TaxID=2306996 RepID=A0A419QZQ7_9SPHN|nr:glycosyl hydrolase family 28-related protein [Tsuneonella suprasediminis]RJX66703.1 hypothetical protein D6858_09920 [Tsuneonella suprasediminis]
MNTRRTFISRGIAGAGVAAMTATSSRSAATEVRPLPAVPMVGSRKAISAIDPQTHQLVYLAEPGREGLFRWTLEIADRIVSSDRVQAIYVRSTLKEHQGAWVRYIESDVKASWFGVVGDGQTNNTAALMEALSFLKQSGGGMLTLPKGIILTDALGNLAQSNLTIRGAGMRETVLRARHEGVAFLADAFPAPVSKQPFVDQFNLEDLTLEGNAGTTDILKMQGIARSHFTRINLREAGAPDSKALHLRCVVTAVFLECFISYNYNSMTHVPKWGVYADEGRRNRISTGHTSNCSFINCEINGVYTGIELVRADQTIMIGGASQNCNGYGIKINNPSRFNTFQNVGFENSNSQADLVDKGVLSNFEGCYFSGKAIFAGQQCRVRNCFGERIEIGKEAEQTDISNIRLSHWKSGSGGIVNLSKSSRLRSIFDIDGGKYLSDV